MPAELAGEPVLTPNSLLLNFKGSDKLTAAGLEKKRSEFYTTHGLKVVNIFPRPGALAVSIARKERQIVPLGTTWKHWQPCPLPYGNTRLLVAVAEEDNSPVFIDPLAGSPHTLIAGRSGSGKGVLLQNILLGIAATNAPECAQIYLIDPKSGVDYAPFSQLPHIAGGIITSRDAALETVARLVDEMEARYPLLARAGVNHVRLYNAKQDKKLPYIWLIHDEFSDWMSTEEYKAGVVAHVSRLGMKARAAGIFLVFATQRPSVEVMPMQLRDNLDSRLILRVASEGASTICLGESGADNLLDNGQMLARLGSSDLTLCQVPFASLEEIEAMCQAIRQRNG
jgi:S-DNA-T family DNA segregation ATPase FtsK/SpoIIIE